MTERAKLVAIVLPLVAGVGLAVYGSQVDLDDDDAVEFVSDTEPRGPKRFFVSDNRGDPVTCPGENAPLRVPGNATPPHAVMEPVPPELGSGDPAAVVRCGPNGKAVWVPETLAERLTAPRRYWQYEIKGARSSYGPLDVDELEAVNVTTADMHSTAGHELSGPIDPSGKVKARISPTREIWPRDRARRYTLAFKRVPVDCEGDAATAAGQRVKFIKFGQLNRIHLEHTMGRASGSRYTVDVSGRRLRPRKAVGHVRIHGSDVPLPADETGHCDSGTLRWKVTG